ncbi:eukaryotic translation initiation factor 4 gamma 2 [Chrysoperla carnea]|uniref:eukaryotic translation initiation factor 4 gamma 2 n=1 Tax=Chrysoperla carnea TaxID=189513 RepID=UPI001D06C710|nr:eukaryotic translation initiation factor 4 gamma 2 [Chrysoperla carnea]XP_044737372.1 eukaryotic translation initiation factor 4 gamma 2 [Chrysoperla carnea]
MYAQLCKQVCKHLCNLKRKESNEDDTTSCTFRTMLLNKCKEEFEKRSKATEAFDLHGSNMSPEDEERRQIAKLKMLGNIKFIGELAKLEILAEAILHKCIQQLLQDTRRRYKDSITPITADHCEDLECLSQILRTCGRILDTVKGQLLMDQYFERMTVLANSPELPPRIRFMLRDVIELRLNKWEPRKAVTTEGPMPINQIRPIDDDGRSVYVNRERRGDRVNTDRDINDRPGGGSNEFFRFPMKMRNEFNDVLMGLSSLGTPSSTSLIHEKFNNYSPNGFGGNRDQGFRGNHNQRSGNFNNYNNQRGGYNKHNNNQHGQNNISHNSQFNNNASNKEVAPRFKKNYILATQSAQSFGDLELRPAANSMLFKQTNIKPVMLPLSSGGNRAGDNVPPQITPPMMQPPAPTKTLPTPVLKEPPLIIKQPSLEKPKQTKKDKGPNKEEVLKKLSTLLDEYLKNDSNAALSEAISSYKEHKVPEKFAKDVVLTMFNSVIDKQDSEKEKLVTFIANLRKESLLMSTACYDGLKALCDTIPDKEAEYPRITSLVASIAAQGILKNLFTLSDVANFTENGAHYPLFLLVLQKINKLRGKSDLTKIFNESKVNLLTQLPESERTKDRLAEILEDRELTFLFPLLRIQAELWKQLQADPNPQQFYKWIKENLEPSSHTDPGFINALMTVLLKYITQESTLREGCDPNVLPDKTYIDKERMLLERYKLVLKAFLNEHVDLQVTAVYSLQVYCYSTHFPKGMLLRFFIALYEFEVIEEEAFLQWKENVTDVYPGKGEALFQVHNWLLWLETAESEDDEAED